MKNSVIIDLDKFLELENFRKEILSGKILLTSGIFYNYQEKLYTESEIIANLDMKIKVLKANNELLAFKIEKETIEKFHKMSILDFIRFKFITKNELGGICNKV